MHLLFLSKYHRLWNEVDDSVFQPLWVLKTAKESKLHRLVHISADLGRQIGTMFDNEKNVSTVKV